MKMATTGICILALLLCCGGHLAMANPFRIEPQNTNVALGETVVVPCILKNTTLSYCNKVFWYRSDKQLYISQDHQIIGHVSNDTGIQVRYSILGNKSTGVYSLQVQGMLESDVGDYRCVCFPKYHGRPYFTPKASLYLVQRPGNQYPICGVRDGTGTLVVGKRVTFLCESMGGTPSVALQWMREGENLVADYTSTPYSISVYHKTITPEDSGAILSCMASGIALKNSRNCTVGPLSVISPLRIQTQTVVAKHGPGRDPRIVFTCNSNVTYSGLAAFNYTWYANSVRITRETPGFVLGDGGRSVQVTDLSLFAQSIHIVCEAQGAQGSLGNVSTFLDMEGIADLPTATHTGDNVLTEPPLKGVVSISNNKFFDIRPFIYLILGAVILMTTMIAIVVCTPKTCCSSTKSDSRLRRRDSQFTTMHYVQQPGTGSPTRAIAHQESLNLYESTDSDTESTRQSATIPLPSSSQKQQVQATLHVVVHSGNENTVNQQHQTTLRTSSANIDDQGIYQEVPPTPPPPPPPPPSSRTLNYHHPKMARATVRTQTWGHSSCNKNPFSYGHVRPDLMHYDSLGRCYVQTLPMKHTKPPVPQSFLYNDLSPYQDWNKTHQNSLYENIPTHGRTMSMSRTGF
ncbi:uncharacterized protein [Asterias amurensis]|uniref:uncharacterized protein n=1 Tax=Asterias amurensis TaxID=7602 RepID=UPI003AB87580